MVSQGTPKYNTQIRLYSLDKRTIATREKKQ